MIGVIANPSERKVACEFFELFKTPWEFYRKGRQYDVLLLCTGDANFDENAAKLVLIYFGEASAFDRERELQIASQRTSTRTFSYKGMRLPIYGASVTFREGRNGV